MDEFECIAGSAENRDRLLELIDGEIVEKAVSQLWALYIGNVFGHIRAYLQQIRLGRVVMEVRYRNPDVSYTSGNEPPVEKGSVPQMPDLAVEVKSPDNSLKTMRQKARHYLANGTKIVWLVDPQRRFVEVYTSDDEQMLFEDDTLDGGEVLPGFQMKVSEIFEDTAQG